jgi:hypothetical protein
MVFSICFGYSIINLLRFFDTRSEDDVILSKKFYFCWIVSISIFYLQFFTPLNILYGVSQEWIANNWIGSLLNQTLEYIQYNLLTLIILSFSIVFGPYTFLVLLNFLFALIRYRNFEKLGYKSRDDYINASKNGFHSAEEYYTALKDRFPNRESYIEALSEKIPNFEEYKIYKQSGFDKYHLFKHARELGIEVVEDYKRFIEGEFPDVDIFNKAKSKGFTKYRDYLAAQALKIENWPTYKIYLEGGFSSIDDFHEAQKIGIHTVDDLNLYKSLKLSSKKELDKLKEIEIKSKSDYQEFIDMLSNLSGKGKLPDKLERYVDSPQKLNVEYVNSKLLDKWLRYKNEKQEFTNLHESLKIKLKSNDLYSLMEIFHEMIKYSWDMEQFDLSESEEIEIEKLFIESYKKLIAEYIKNYPNVPVNELKKLSYLPKNIDLIKLINKHLPHLIVDGNLIKTSNLAMDEIEKIQQLFLDLKTELNNEKDRTYFNF